MNKNYQIKLLSKEEVAVDTFSFIFEKPEDFEFKPGQYINMDLTGKILEKDEKGSSRFFSIGSSICSKSLRFTTRISSSSFKKALKNLEIGEYVNISESKGRFGLKEDQKRHIFLIGGIGITPVLSILDTINCENETEIIKNEIIIFYSNHTISSTPFFHRFTEKYLDQVFIKSGYKVKMVFLITKELTTDFPKIFNSRINEAIIKNESYSFFNVSRMQNIQYYIVGAPDFVKNINNFVQNIGIDKKEISLDSFVGY